MHAITLELPAGWRVYRGALTQAIDVTEQLALGTFPLHQRRPDRNCTPATALRARPAGGGFVYAFEIDPIRRERERLPHTPSLPPAALPYECMGPSWLVRWRVGSRAFQAHIYGPAARRRQALAILRSLRARPAPFTSRTPRTSRARRGGTRAWITSRTAGRAGASASRGRQRCRSATGATSCRPTARSPICRRTGS